MKKISKALSLMIVLVMVLMAFSACGKDKVEDQTDDNNQVVDNNDKDQKDDIDSKDDNDTKDNNDSDPAGVDTPMVVGYLAFQDRKSVV